MNQMPYLFIGLTKIGIEFGTWEMRRLNVALGLVQTSHLEFEILIDQQVPSKGYQVRFNFLH
jgi:hypothetical protein